MIRVTAALFFMLGRMEFVTKAVSYQKREDTFSVIHISKTVQCDMMTDGKISFLCLFGAR